MKTLAFVLLSTLLCACQSPSIPTQSTATPSQQQAQDTTGNLILSSMMPKSVPRHC
ncbi:hypothetical protein ACTHSK_08720 [Neisseria sp. P0012.S006]|uniref:hypothetical protein n=1 Tax=unclassified Neisseria TaxID=2623750 RepID=UPI003F804377